MPNKVWTGFHQRNILSENVVLRTKLEAGQIVRFNYSGDRSHIKRPLVLILNPDWRSYLHGVVLDYVSDRVLIKLHDIIKETKTERLQKLLHLRLPLLKATIQDPRRFYDNELKPFIRLHFNEGDSPYRTYKVSGITNLRLIYYHYKDFYSGLDENMPNDLKSKT